MARFDPFPGVRYGEQESLGDVIAPPYDVVAEPDREALAARSEHNSILVELPVEDPARGLDRYANAARLLGEWLEDGVLVREEAPAFYVYRMSFRDDSGGERSTTGVIGSLGLDPDHKGDVLPHEQTTPKAKSDRLDLLRATRTNLSPIWGLSLAAGLTAVAEEAVAGLPSQSAVSEGVTHEIWPVLDPTVIAEIATRIAATPVLLADGHHRYETACTYRAERLAAGEEDGAALDGVMAYVVELVEEELFVRAIHRLLADLPAGVDLARALSEFFDVRDGPATVDELLDTMGEVGALGLYTDGRTHYLIPLAETVAAADADLDSSRLDVALAALTGHTLSYQHGRHEPAAAVDSGEAQAAVYLRPATVAQIAEIAHGGRRMPPKTTFFEPKPRTGMVFRRLD